MNVLIIYVSGKEHGGHPTNLPVEFWIGLFIMCALAH